MTYERGNVRSVPIKPCPHQALRSCPRQAVPIKPRNSCDRAEQIGGHDLYPRKRTAMTVAVKRHQAPRQRIPPEVPFSRSHFRYVDSISLIGVSNQLLHSTDAIWNPLQTSFMQLFIARKSLPFSSRSSMFGQLAITCCRSSASSPNRECFSQSSRCAEVAFIHRSTMSCSFADKLSIPMQVEAIISRLGYPMMELLRSEI